MVLCDVQGFHKEAEVLILLTKKLRHGELKCLVPDHALKGTTSWHL